MKRMIVVLVSVLFLSAAAIAGPTLGVGYGWVGGQGWLAPSIGSVLNTPIGVSMDAYIAGFLTTPGWDFLGAFFFTLTGTMELPLWRCPPDMECPYVGPTFYLVAGIGSPVLAGVNADGFQAEGFEIGAVFGVGVRGDNGIGAKAIAYVNQEFVGIGVNVYVDFFTLARAIDK